MVWSPGSGWAFGPRRDGTDLFLPHRRPKRFTDIAYLIPLTQGNHSGIPLQGGGVADTRICACSIKFPDN